MPYASTRYFTQVEEIIREINEDKTTYWKEQQNITGITIHYDVQDDGQVFYEDSKYRSWYSLEQKYSYHEFMEAYNDKVQDKTIKGNGAIMNNQVDTQDVKNKNDNILYVEFSLLSVFFETKEKVIVVLNNKKFIWIDKAYTRKNDLKLSFSASFYIANKDGKLNTIKLFDYNTVTKRYDENGGFVSIKELEFLA